MAARLAYLSLASRIKSTTQACAILHVSMMLMVRASSAGVNALKILRSEALSASLKIIFTAHYIAKRIRKMPT